MAGPMTLRPYQQRAVAAIHEAWAQGARRVCCVMPTGAGKTYTATAATAGLDALWLVPSTALRVQAPGRAVTVQSLLSGRRPACDVLIADECFPAGTMVEGTPIDRIQKGHRLSTGEVTRTFKSKPKSICVVSLADGAKIACTPGHPFMTEAGWMPAIDLTGRQVVRYTIWHEKEQNCEMLHVRGVDNGGHVGNAAEVEKEQTGALLLKGLHECGPFPDHGEDESFICVGAHEEKQSDASTGDTGSREYQVAGYGAQTEGARRQWAPGTGSTTPSCLCSRVGHRGCRKDRGKEGERLPFLLQGGHRQRRFNDRPGDRRKLSLRIEAQRTGQKKGRVFEWTRVDSVEIQKRTSDGRFGGLCPDGFVYNLEVEGSHIYFADGIQVHNCHHLAGQAEKWKAIIQDYPRVLGLTATPCRHDGAPLGESFDHLVVGAHYSELLAGGYIVPARVYRPVEVPEESGLADEPTRAWTQWGAGRRGFAFFGRVELAKRWAARVDAGIITGEQGAEEREATMRLFRGGYLRALASVQCLTEGVDVPAAEVCMLARGVSHEGAYLQMVGRVLRPAPGKTEAIVIDLPGASWRYGLPTDDREYSLEGTAMRRAAGVPALSQCLQCGAVYEAEPVCPRCGWVRPPKPPRVRIWGVELVEAGAELTPAQRGKLSWRDHMMEDCEARLAWFRAKGWPPRRVAGAHRGMFGVAMPASWWGRLK